MNIQAVSPIKAATFPKNQAGATLNLQNNNLPARQTIDENKTNEKMSKIQCLPYWTWQMSATFFMFILPKDDAKEMKDMVERANDSAKSFQERFQSTIDETIEIYNNNGKDKNGNIVAKIKVIDPQNPKRKYMDEFALNGTCIKTSWFIDDKLDYIEKLTDKNKYDTVMMDENGKMEFCKEGITRFKNGEKTEKEFVLKNGKPLIYSENESYTDSGSEHGIGYTEKEIIISNNRPVSYIKGWKRDGTDRAEKWLTIGDDGKWRDISNGQNEIIF